MRLYSQASDLFLHNSGGIDATAASRVQLSDIVFTQPSSAQNSYAIDLGSNQLSNALIDGLNISTCHGIQTVAGSVTNCEVQRLNGREGIRATGTLATLVGNRAFALGTGTPFVYTAGNIASGNYGYPRMANTSSAGTAALNAESGQITTESLTTASGAIYALTITNSLIAVTSTVAVSIKEESNIAGTPVVVNVYTMNGSVLIWIQNVHAADAFNGSLIVQFSVRN